MKKSAKVYLVVFVWVCALLQLVFVIRLDRKVALSAMTTEEADNGAKACIAKEGQQDETQILVWGNYQEAMYDETTIENILINIAREYGIKGELKIQSEDFGKWQQIFISCKNDSAATRIEFLQNKELYQQYLMTSISIYGETSEHLEEAVNSMDMVTKLYESLGIEYQNTITEIVHGSK